MNAGTDYFERLRCRAVNPTPQMNVEELMPTLAIVDADDGAGCVASKKAMELTIEKAKEFGIAMVCVVNSNHFGAAAEYAQMAVDQGMIGPFHTMSDAEWLRRLRQLVENSLPWYPHV